MAARCLGRRTFSQCELRGGLPIGCGQQPICGAVGGDGETGCCVGRARQWPKCSANLRRHATCLRSSIKWMRTSPLSNRVREVIADLPPHTTWHAGPHQAVRRTSLSSFATALGKVRCRSLGSATAVSVIVSETNSRRVSLAAPSRYVPVGTVSLWSSRSCPKTWTTGGSLAARRGMTLPCSSSFGPSQSRWCATGWYYDRC